MDGQNRAPKGHSNK